MKKIRAANIVSCIAHKGRVILDSLVAEDGCAIGQCDPTAVYCTKPYEDKKN